MENKGPQMACPHCKAQIPEGSEICPMCGGKIRPRLGTLTDEQIKRIRRPISIVLWAVVIIVIYIKYFR